MLQSEAVIYEAAKLGATYQLPTQGDSRPVAPRFAAVQQLHFTA